MVSFRYPESLGNTVKYSLPTVWSHLYSFSFAPNPDWSREYPGQREIHDYLSSVAADWKLYPRIRFNSAVTEARWNDATKQWIVGVQVNGGKAAEFCDSYTIKVDYLVSGVGQLNVPQFPDIKGLDTFEGKTMHSARWDFSYPIQGKRVAVIGNGATAAQIIPQMATQCTKVTVFQRTPNWVIPRGDKLITPATRAMYRYLPGYRSRYRASLMDIRENFFDAAVVEDSALNISIKQACLDMMKGAMTEKPEMIEDLVPDYPPGCKRILISDDYYPALNKPNVSLETRHIQSINSSGIVVEGGEELDFDVIILATGFRAVEFMYPIKITGLGGIPLPEIWKAGAQAYLGMTVSSLPNFAMLYGPNTNLGHNSIVLMIEAQSRYITTMIREVANARNRGQKLVVVPAALPMAKFNREIQARLEKSTFAHVSCNSWYKNKDGLITNNWCGSVIEYQQRTARVVWSDYDLSGSGAGSLKQAAPTYIGRVIEETRLGPWALSGLALAGVTVVVATAKPVVIRSIFGSSTSRR
jgi:cation diffusion facilitator CzcD-associated flavoprotein CzcO